jgi:hypothetical protein
MLTGTLSQVSNKADWIEAFEIFDGDTNEPVDISDADEITIEIKDQNDCSVLAQATLTGDTVELVSTGVFQWTFSAATMTTLCPGTYPVKARINKDDIETQLLIGFLPVVNG